MQAAVWSKGSEEVCELEEGHRKGKRDAGREKNKRS